MEWLGLAWKILHFNYLHSKIEGFITEEISKQQYFFFLFRSVSSFVCFFGVVLFGSFKTGSHNVAVTQIDLKFANFLTGSLEY